MKTQHKYVLLLLAGIFSFSTIYAQSNLVNPSDSTNLKLLQKLTTDFKEANQQQVTDSLKKVALETQFKTLKTNDVSTKETLLFQLKALEKKDSSTIATKKKIIDSLRKNTTPYPVIGFFNDTLFCIYNRLGSFSALERANAISARIKKLPANLSFTDSTLQLVSEETATDIVEGENVLMSVTENDAIWNNTTKDELAKKYTLIIGDAVRRFKNETKLSTLIKEFGWALCVLILWILLLYTNAKFFAWMGTKIIEQKGKKIKGLNVKNYTLLDAERQASILFSVSQFTKWLVIFILTYTAFPIIFGFFPWTKNIAETLFGYAFRPLQQMAVGFWKYLPNLITIIVICLVFKYVIKVLNILRREIADGKLQLQGFYPDWATPTFQIIKVILYAFMFVLIFPYLPGSNSPVFQGVSVFLGFLLTFGSSGSLSNIFAGIVLTYMRLFKIGDRVKIGEVEGDIIEKSMLVTRVRTTKNEIISIPNATVMSSHTINYSNIIENGEGLIIHTTVTIGYDVPWKKMHQALLNAANRTHLLQKESKPFVLQTSLDDFFVSYQINAYTKEPNKQATIYSELHQNIQDCCNELGIEILSPHYRAVRDGNMSTIPTSSQPKERKET